jgi:transcriptional regulator with XRE-family HTH domain
LAKDKAKKKQRLSQAAVASPQVQASAPGLPSGTAAEPALAASRRSGARPAVGREVRRWRRARSMTLANVAARSGLNIGYLSQIENEKAVPSLDALVAIAGALEVPPAWMLLDSSPAPRVVRRADRPKADVGDSGTVSEVDGGTGRDIAITELLLPPGGASGMQDQTGDEHHLVLEGRWRMSQGDDVIELGPGDYLSWDPSVPHQVENVGDAPGRLLLVRPRNSLRGKTEAGP